MQVSKSDKHCLENQANLGQMYSLNFPFRSPDFILHFFLKIFVREALESERQKILFPIRLKLSCKSAQSHQFLLRKYKWTEQNEFLRLSSPILCCVQITKCSLDMTVNCCSSDRVSLLTYKSLVTRKQDKVVSDQVCFKLACSLK